MSTEITAHDALRLQVAMIAGDEPADSFVEVRRLRRTGRPLTPAGQSFHPVRNLKEITLAVLGTPDNVEVCLGAAPRVRERGQAKDVQRAWALRADIDTPEAVGRLKAFRPRPSMLVRTSPGRGHAWWALREPLESMLSESLHLRLACALRADPAVADAARVMRAIGSLNHKTKPPTRVECVAIELLTYSAEDFGQLPRVPLATPKRPAPRAPRVGRGTDLDALRLIPSAEYVPDLTGREVTGQGFVQCPWHAGGSERTASLHVTEDSGAWYCHACRAGGGLLEFYARLNDQYLPNGGAAFAAFVRAAAESLLKSAAA